MSNVIPYFVLAVVALGFFAICYAVFNRNDGESQASKSIVIDLVLSLMMNIIKKGPLMNPR